MLRPMLLILFASFCAAAPAAASAPAPAPSEIQAGLVSSVSTVAPDSEFVVALRLKMDRDWHTYWKNPGEGGLATEIKWEMPAGFTAGPLEWPSPKRFTTSDIVNYGYEDEVLLLTTFRAPANLATGRPVRIAAAARWLGCNKICVPGKADLELELGTAAAPSASADAPRIAAAMRRIPAPLRGWKLRAWLEGTTIHLELAPGTGVRVSDTKNLYFYADDASVIEYAAPQHLEHVGEHLRLRLEASDSAPAGGPKVLRGVVEGPEGWSGSPGAAFAVEVFVEKDPYTRKDK